MRSSAPVSARALGHVIEPGVLADRHAEPHASAIERAGHRAGVEHALFVEHRIVGQMDLGAHAGDRLPPSIITTAL
jgi:hypothetical protein